MQLLHTVLTQPNVHCTVYNHPSGPLHVPLGIQTDQAGPEPGEADVFLENCARIFESAIGADDSGPPGCFKGAGSAQEMVQISGQHFSCLGN